jgi:hypothetical protein
MNASKSARAVFRFVEMNHAVGVGVPLEEDEVVDCVVLEGCVVVIVVSVAVVSVFVVVAPPVVAVPTSFSSYRVY